MTHDEFIDYLKTPSWGRRLSVVDENTFKGQVYKRLLELSNEYNYPEELPLPAKRWLLINDLKEIPLCKNCKINKTKWGQELGRFRDYCCKQCSNNDEDKYNAAANTRINLSAEKKLAIKEKTKKTNLERFGTEYALQNNDIKERVAQTNIERYGYKSTFSNEDVRNKHKQNMLEKYGVDNPMKLDSIKTKLTQTMIEKYGTERYAQTQEFKDNYRNKWLEEIDREHHTQAHISKESLELLNNKEWLIDQHHNNKKTIRELSDELKVNGTTISNHFKKFNIKVKYNKGFSYVEKELLDYLTNSSVATTTKILSNNKKTIKNDGGHFMELDIYIPEKNIAIEFCGLYWHSDVYKDKDYHFTKYKLCKEKGIRLITLFEDEWVKNRSLVENKLNHLLGITNDKKIFARKTNIIEIDTKSKQEFFDKYHIQGDGPSSINYGLKYNNELVAVIGFIKNNDESYTLNRYATSCNVVGGFTKLLTHFEREYNKPKIITFADLRWSEGNLYYKSGFTMDKILKPDYYWVKKYSRYHKFNFRHAQMKQKLKNYEPTLSESENMYNHKFHKIYDCGKLRFIKN